MKTKIIYLLCFSFVLSGNCQITQINTGTTTHLADVSVIDKNIMVCGFFNYLVKSYDECDNFSNVLMPGPATYANNLVRVDTNNLYLVSFTPNQTLLYKSTDGGNNWIEKLDTIGGWRSEFDFFDINEGLMMSSDKSLMRTKDGGNSWSHAYYFQNMFGITAIKTYGDSMVCVGAGSNSGLIFLSKDRGHTWLTDVWPVQGTTVTDIFFLNKDTIFCTGDARNIYYNSISLTTNGGQTWSLREIPLFTALGVNFKSTKEGYVLGSNTQTMGIVLRTTDLGQTWTTFNTGVKTALFGIHFLNDSIALLNGSDGVLLKWNYKNSIFTSISENYFENVGLKIFPNPVSDKLSFEFNTNLIKDVNLKINNSIGQIVYQSSSSDLNKELDISFLRAGVYYLRIENDKGFKVFKVVKE